MTANIPDNISPRFGASDHAAHPAPSIAFDPERMAMAGAFLQCTNETLNEIPALPGWGLLTLWAALPFVGFWVGISVFRGWSGLLAGLVLAVLAFLFGALAIGALREGIRKRRFQQVVYPQLVRFIQENDFSMDELIFLSRRQFAGQSGASLLTYLDQSRSA